MKSLRLRAALLVPALLLAFWGCGGGGARNVNEVRSATLGQELMDLDQAYKNGVISEREYKDMKKKVVEKYR